MSQEKGTQQKPKIKRSNAILKSHKDNQGLGQKYTLPKINKLNRIKILTIRQFIEQYKIKLVPTAITLHVKDGKIDYVKPLRDVFIVVSKRTLEFYKSIGQIKSVKKLKSK